MHVRLRVWWCSSAGNQVAVPCSCAACLSELLVSTAISPHHSAVLWRGPHKVLADAMCVQTSAQLGKVGVGLVQ